MENSNYNIDEAVKKAIKNLLVEVRYEKKDIYKIETILEVIENNKSESNNDNRLNDLIEQLANIYTNQKEINNSESVSVGPVYKKITSNYAEKSITNQVDNLIKTFEKKNRAALKEELTNIIDQKKNIDSTDKIIYVSSKENYSSKLKVECNNIIKFKSFEPYISSQLWVDLIGRYLFELPQYKKYMKNIYANKLYPQKHSRLFKPYYENYKDFISIALDEIKYAKEKKTDIIIFQLDLKSYYSSINIDAITEEITRTVGENSIHNWETDDFIKALNANEMEMLKVYSEKSKGLPIGTASSKVISNLYGARVDEYVLETKPLRYGRYVDDLIIIYEYIDKKEGVHDYVKSFKDLDKSFCDHLMDNKLELNDSKTKTFIVPSNISSSAVKSLEATIWRDSSDFHNFPDVMNVEDNNLLEIQPKLDLDIIDSNISLLKAKQLISIIFKRLVRQKNDEDTNLKEDISIFIDTLKKINALIDDISLIELSDYWMKLEYFDYILEKNDEEKLFDIEKHIKKMKSIQKEELYIQDEKEKIEMENLKKLDGWQKTASSNAKKIYELKRYIYPYEKMYERQVELLDKFFSKEGIAQENTDMKNTIVKGIEDINGIIDEISKTNTIRKKYGDGIETINFTDYYTQKDEITVALYVEKGNNKYLKDFLVENSMTDFEKNKLANLDQLRSLVENTDDVLLLPESSISFRNLSEFCELATKNKTIIIGGLFYQNIGNYIVNFLVTIVPYEKQIGGKKTGEMDAYIHLRPKNFMAPAERELIESSRAKYSSQNYIAFEFEERNYPRFIFNSKFSIQSLNCFEAYDIYSRAKISHETSLITLHESNRDIETYKHLSRSLTTDFKSFVAQVNYSEYGDIGIFMPKGSYKKELICVRGGANNRVVRDKISFEKLYCARHCGPYSTKNGFKPNSPIQNGFNPN